jgi:anaerobic selenocysteine-containing dehydrogenase
MQIRKSICRICNNQCRIEVVVDDGRPIRVEGDARNPYSQGYFCVKGRALPEFQRHPKRLLRPLVVRYRQPGRAGLAVSELCLGTMTFGRAEGLYKPINGVDQSGAETLVAKALERGVNT